MSRFTVCLRTIASLVLMLGVAGCNGAAAALKERALALQVTAETYRKLMRWSDFEAAAQYCKARDGESAPIDLAPYKDWKVAAYDVGDAALANDSTEAVFVAEVAFYNKDTRVAGTLRDTQRWWYDAQAKRWFLASPLPDFAAAARKPR